MNDSHFHKVLARDCYFNVFSNHPVHTSSYPHNEAANKKNLVLLHGALGATSVDFKPQIEYFCNKQEYNVIGIDMRGYGLSNTNAELKPIQRVFEAEPPNFFYQDAFDVHEVLRKIGVYNCSVLGWSDGATVAMVLASLNHKKPEKYTTVVDNLVIWGGSAYNEQQDIDYMETTRDTTKWKKIHYDRYMKRYSPEELQRNNDEYIDVLQELVTKYEGDFIKLELDHITSNTLILHGMKDPIIRKELVDYVEMNIGPNNTDSNVFDLITEQNIILERYNFDNGSHNIHLRYPEEFNQAVEEFLKKTGY